MEVEDSGEGGREEGGVLQTTLVTVRNVPNVIYNTCLDDKFPQDNFLDKFRTFFSHLALKVEKT